MQGGTALAPSPGKAYVAPSIAVALAERLKKHPSVDTHDVREISGKRPPAAWAGLCATTPPRPHSRTHPPFPRPPPRQDPTGPRRRLFGCCATTGRFCGASCECMDPCCEGKESSFVLYGAGATSYFKGLKVLAWTAFFMAACYVPCLLINVNGRATLSSMSALTLAATTLGNNGLLGAGAANVSLGGNVTAGLLAVPGWELLSGGRAGMQPTTAVLIYALCDVAACAFFLAAFLWMKWAEGVEGRQVNKMTVTADDYTVYLPWVPPETTEADLREYFARLTAKPTAEAWAAKQYTNLFDVVDVQIVEDNASTVGDFKRRGAVLMEVERAVQKIKHLQLKMDMHNDAGCCAPSYQRQMRRLLAKKAALDAEAEAMGKTAVLRASSAAVGAFVTFDRAEARDWVLEQFPSGFAAWLCQGAFFRLRGHRVEVMEAPPPTAVIWENLHVTNCERAARIGVTSLLTLIALTGSFVALWFASWKAAQFQDGASVANCAAVAAAGTSYCPTARDLTAFLNTSVKDTAHYCTCACMGWASYSYEQLTRAPTPLEVATQGVLPASACPFQACPRWFTFDVQGVWSQPFCVEWASNRGIVLGLTVASSVIVLLINVFLGVIMRALTRFEGHKFVDDLNSSLALRMLLACFANTALLVVLINVAWPNMPDTGTGFLVPGKFSDFSVGWYNTVGVSLITTMLINVAAPHVYPLVAALAYCRRVANPDLTAPTQRDLNEKVLGPYEDVSMRYAQLYNILFVTFTFSTGMPLMLPVLAFSCIVFYWVDKMNFMWYYRAPKTSGTKLQSMMTSLMPVALLLHLGIGVWQLSAVPSIAAIANGVAAYQSLVSLTSPWVNRATLLVASLENSMLLAGVTRVTDTGVLPLFIMFLVVLVAMALWALQKVVGSFLLTALKVATCNCICCASCFAGNANPWYFEVPSYTWATSPEKNEKDARWQAFRMQGVPSYNILMNPEIMQAFAIPKSFAKTHHHRECGRPPLPPQLRPPPLPPPRHLTRPDKHTHTHTHTRARAHQRTRSHRRGRV